MKIVCHIFFILISFMVFYPCSDGLTCADEKSKGVQTTDESHEHSSNEKDVCSPFCQCNCCHTQVSQPSLYTFTTVSSPMRVQRSLDAYSSFQSLIQSIWKPPKIS